MIKYRQFLLALLTCLSAQQVYSQNLDYVSVAFQCLDRKEYTKAFDYMKKGALEGNVGAQCNLGSFYAQGLGTPKNISAAIEWWKKAAEQGHAISMYYIATSYLDGNNGIPVDKATALYWLTKSSDYGNTEAKLTLVDFYLKGDGITKDISKAVLLLKQIIESTNCQKETKINAVLQLAALYQDEESVRDYTKSHELWLQAAKAGDVLGMYMTGMDFIQGRGVEKNVEQSLKWIQLGADMGHPECQFQLHLYYKLGIGVEKDETKAKDLFNRAYKGGSIRALKLLMDMYGEK